MDPDRTAAAQVGSLGSFLDQTVPPVVNLVARFRILFFDVLENNVPFRVMHSLQAQSITHILSAVSTVYMIGAVLSTTGGLSLFAFHPIFMTLGCVLLLSEGFLVYRNSVLVGAFSEIMAAAPPKGKARSLHVCLQMSGGACALLGLVFIAANKVRQGKPLLPGSLHAALGTAALALVAVQAFAGARKAASSFPVHRWHGNAGKLCYDLCMAAVLSGALSFLPFNLANAGAVFSVALLWLTTELQHTLGTAGNKGDRWGGGLRAEDLESSDTSLLSRQGSVERGLTGGGGVIGDPPPDDRDP